MLRSHLLLTFPFLSQLVLAQGPVFYWPLDESSGTVAYAAAGGSNGSLQSGVEWDPTGGHHDGAARFDGVDDRILLGGCDLTGGTGFSISLWVKPDFVTGMERTLIAKTLGPLASDHIWSLAFVNATAIRFRLTAGGTMTELTSAPSSLFGGNWYHIVAAYDGAEMRILINGALMANTTKTGSVGYAPQAPASLGAQSTGFAPISAWLDDVRIYDRGLSDQEILNILFETLTTGIAEQQNVTLHADGQLQLPAGAWNALRVMDTTGRLSEEQHLINGSTAVDLAPLPAGIYLVCLQGHGARWTQRILVP
ncbi:MAG: LamG-like jellyroll fold domain-containing protein [Flavobacteriales bacterium]